MGGVAIGPVLDYLIFILLIFAGYLLLKKAAEMLRGGSPGRAFAGLGIGLLGLGAVAFGICMKFGVIELI